MMKIILMLFILSSLLACNVPPSYSEIKPGARLIIHQTLTINAGSARVMLQHGKIINLRQLETYQPRCWFVAQQVKSSSQKITPGVFSIKRVKQHDEIVQVPVSGYPLASMLSSASFTAVDYATEFDLESAQHPGISRLICSHWEDPDDAEHLTVKQINAALGDYASIEMN